MYAALAFAYALLGLSLIVAGVYRATPTGGRVSQFLPFAGVALVFCALGGGMLYLYLYATLTAPALGARPAPVAPTLVMAMPVLGALVVALQVFFLLRRRARYQRATWENQHQ